MKILISNISNIPLYQQIKDQVKDVIFKGDILEGDQLPSIRNFDTDLKVSIITIRRVYNELEQDGFITSRMGVGTFIAVVNLELPRDSKRRIVEQKMQDLIQIANMLKICKEELNTMMNILYENEQWEIY